MINMWKDKCNKCGRNIFNGIPEEHRDHIDTYIKDMEKEGMFIGHNTKTVGTWGHINEVPIKPICCVCKKEEYEIKNAKDTKKAFIKIKKSLKKVFVCPICLDSTHRGYNEKVFMTTIRTVIENHIKEKHNLSEYESIISELKNY